MTTLITGAAGFIGFHVAKALLDIGESVVGYDNLNDYYDKRVKLRRLDILHEYKRFRFTRGDLQNEDLLHDVWRREGPEYVIHLAAQAGVRHSLEHPMDYVHSNLVGFQNVLELVRLYRPQNFVYASSSSVYAGNKEMPFHEGMDVSNPASFYALTKVSNEIAAKCYGELYQIPSTGLRFFTVYGPHGRPDMAMWIFADKMLKGEVVSLYNHGMMLRDFTYVNDIVAGIIKARDKAQIGAVYNLGRGDTISLMDVVKHLESELGTKARLKMLPIQKGDVDATWADISKAKAELGYAPKTDIKEGVAKFAQWFLENHKRESAA